MLYETIYSKPDLAIGDKVTEGMKAIPDNWDHYPTIDLLELFQASLPGWSFSLVDDTGQWKYGAVDIKQAWLDGRGTIHVEVGNDFFEKNLDNHKELTRVLRAILAHEDTHRQQYVHDPSMTVDDDNYMEDTHEIDAHAREAAQELIDLDVSDLSDNDVWANSDTAYRYWEDYGRYVDEDETAKAVWDRFYTELQDYME